MYDESYHKIKWFFVSARGAFVRLGPTCRRDERRPASVGIAGSTNPSPREEQSRGKALEEWARLGHAL